MVLPRRFHRLRSILDRRQPDLTVLMDNVHKPHNVAAVLRSCDAVGVFEAHAIHSEAVFRAPRKSASGTQRYVSLRVHASRREAFAGLREAGFRILAADLDAAAIDFRDVDFTQPTAVLLGSELDGVSSEAAFAADGSITIPMLGAVDSLNVSVAAAVILFEAQRQRLQAGLYESCRLPRERYATTLFEWAYPRPAELCRRRGLSYPRLGPDGEVLGPLPR